ncbi:MAG: 3-keto-disaccharide hydrolase [Gemmatimonadales bacterium]
MTPARLPYMAACILAAATAEAQAPNTLTATERASGWRLLFDGRTTAGWRGFRKQSIPSGWRVVDGALTRVGGGGDIITTQKFKNFELALEWNIAPGGNSGVFYRASENDDIHWTAPEMQVLDDARHPDGRSRLTAAGANFGLHPAPAGIVKPAGQWNQARLIVSGRHVEHWLNDVRVLQYELWSPNWEVRVMKSKFAKHPLYGRNLEGYIGLQDHGDRVAYRSIKIRVLP